MTQPDREELAVALLDIDYESSDLPLVRFQGRMVHIDNLMASAAAALRQSPSVDEAVHEERQKSQAIINDRDKWIVELIRERDAALDLIRRAVKEAIPDAMIFAAHPEAARYKKALDGLRAWSTEAQAVDRLYRGSKE